MADAWDTYLKRQQKGPATPTTAPRDTGLLGLLFGALGGSSSSSSGGPNKQGLYTPGLGQPTVGPQTPINYGAIRSLLSSGALRTGGQMPAPMQAPAPAPMAETDTPKAAAPRSPLLSFLLGGGK